jgi:hypothetical protein
MMNTSDWVEHSASPQWQQIPVAESFLTSFFISYLERERKESQDTNQPQEEVITRNTSPSSLFDCFNITILLNI